jgi:hypothetical protein
MSSWAEMSSTFLGRLQRAVGREKVVRRVFFARAIFGPDPLFHTSVCPTHYFSTHGRRRWPEREWLPSPSPSAADALDPAPAPPPRPKKEEAMEGEVEVVSWGESFERPAESAKDRPR